MPCFSGNLTGLYLIAQIIILRIHNGGEKAHDLKCLKCASYLVKNIHITSNMHFNCVPYLINGF